VAVANAILLVTFAEGYRNEGEGTAQAALAGARGRVRPILMTSCAMIAGMAPMALGWNEGGEQSAPLGRAVIGGLAAATLATLAILPAVFAVAQAGARRQSASIDPFDPHSAHFIPTHGEGGLTAGSPANGEEDVPLAVKPPVSRGLMGLIALVTLGTAISGCARSSPAQSNQGQEKIAGAPAGTRVEVVQPERRTIRRTTQQPGQIEAFEATPIHARVAGYVQAWNVDIGTRVKKGQVLAVLSVPELDAEAEQKQAAVEEAQAKLSQARAAEEVAKASLVSVQDRLIEVQAGVKRVEADLTRWKAESARVEQLYRERALTGSLLDETRSKVRASEAASDEVQAQVKTAEAAVDHARALLDKARADVTAAFAGIQVARTDARHTQALRAYASIAAPYNGVITQRNVDVGDLPQTGSQGSPLFTMARDDLVRIIVSVPEMFAATVNPGNPVLIRLQALAGREIEGKVSRTSWSLDPRTRTLRAEIDVPNPSGTLRPGLYVNATITVEEHRDTLTVPSTALVRQDARIYCIAVVDGHALRKPVAPGLDDGTLVEILSGLQGNEVIVKAAAASLVDGQPVTVIEPELHKAKP
jgi:RND family efflux transporter MFP subunit